MMNNAIKILGFLLIAVIGIGFASKKQSSMQVGKVNIDLKSADANYFVEEEEIQDLLEKSTYGNINNVKASKLNLKSLEKKIESHSHIRDAEVFQDLGGNLTIKITEHQPIARIFSRKSPDLYIGSTGKIIPESKKYTSRVMMLEFEKQPKLKHTIRELPYGDQLFDFLAYVREDKFWSAQIAYVHINKKDEVEIYPQVTKQLVELGSLEGYEKKLKKLMLFYREILPRKGWNTYDKVSLKYENQIVCE